MALSKCLTRCCFNFLCTTAKHLESTIEINPNDAEARQCLAVVHKKLKQQRQWAKKSGDSFQSPNGQKRSKPAVQQSPWRKVNKVSAAKLSDTMTNQKRQKKKKQ